jgi:hypothetical protein
MCGFSVHRHHTAECLGFYVTEWGTMGTLDDGEYGDPDTYPGFCFWTVEGRIFWQNEKRAYRLVNKVGR